MDGERDLERESEGEEKRKSVEFRNNGEDEGDGEVAILYMTHLVLYLSCIYRKVGRCVYMFI